MKPSDRPCLYSAEEGAGMTRILLNHSIRNPLSFLLIFFLIFSVFIFSMPSKSVNDSKTIYVLKTIIYNDIFTSLGHKKFKVRLNSSRTCSVCVRITCDEMESSFAVFNHVKSARNFQFPRQFRSLSTTFSKPITKE